MHKELSGFIPIFTFCCMHHPIYGNKLHYETYKRGEILHSQQDPIEHFGLVIDGVLKAEKYTTQGDALCCAYFENNDVFPELLYFTGKRVYTYTLVAVRKTTVAWIPVEEMETMLKEDHELMYAFMLYLSKRGMKNQMLLSCLEYKTIRERVAYWLISMHGISENEHIPMPQSQTIWANTLHVSRSSLNQELKHMEEDQLIERVEGSIIVLDKYRLEQML